MTTSTRDRRLAEYREPRPYVGIRDRKTGYLWTAGVGAELMTQAEAKDTCALWASLWGIECDPVLDSPSRAGRPWQP